MANNTKNNLDKINHMLTPKSTIKRYSEFVENSREGINDAFSYAKKMGVKAADSVSGAIDDVARRFGRSTGTAPTSSVGQYQSRLSDGRVAPASSVTGEAAPSAIPTANEEIVATAKSYNTATPTTEPSVSPSVSEEKVGETKTYNGGFKTDALEAGSYTEMLNKHQVLIDKNKSEAYEEADDQLNIDMRDAQSNYKQNDPRYGATAENLLSQGLGDSGYGEHLAGKREEQLSDERMAARSRHSYARLTADKAHDDATLDLNTMRGQYAKELEAEYKAIYTTVLKEVNSGIYDAQIGAKILEQYAGGALDQDTLNALSAAELSATRSGQASTIGAITEYLNGFEIPPTVDMMKDYLDGLNLTGTQKNNILAAMFDENGKFVGKFGTTNSSNKPLTGGYPNDDTEGDNTGDNTGTTIPDGFAYITEAELIKQFKEDVGREPTADELVAAKTRLTAHGDGYIFKDGTTIRDLFELVSYSADTIKKYLEQEFGSVSDEQFKQVLAMCGKLSDGTYILPDTEDYKNIFNSGNAGNSGNSITMTPTEQAVKDLKEKGSTTVNDDFVKETMAGLVISSAVYNADGSQIRTNVDGDNFSIKMGGEKYRIQHGGRATELQGVDLSGVKEGTVFGYNGKLYVMTGKGAFRIEARDISYKDHYKNLLAAVYGEAFKRKGEDGKYVKGLGNYVNVKEGKGATWIFGDDAVELNKVLEDKVIVSSARFDTVAGNILGGKIRAKTVGDNFSVDMGDKTYKVQNEGIVTDAELLSVLNSTKGIYKGDVAAYKGELYIRGDSNWYKIGARDLINKSSYNELKNAVYEEANKDNLSNHSIGGDIDMISYEKELDKSDSSAEASGESGRGQAYASKIFDDAKDGSGWINVNVNGSHFHVKLTGEASDIDAGGAANNEVFLVNGTPYMKMDGKVYKVSKRLFFDDDYNSMVKAIKDNFGDQIGKGYSNAAVDLYAYASKDTGRSIVGTDKFKNLKYDKNVILTLGGGIYRFDIDAVLGSDSDAYKAASAAGIAVGNAFAHGEDIYLMAEDKCFKLGARDFFYNGDYDMFKNAVAGAVQNKSFDDNNNEVLHKVESDNIEYIYDVPADYAVEINKKHAELFKLDAKSEEGSVKEAIELLANAEVVDGIYTYKGNVYVKHQGATYIMPNNKLNHENWKAVFESSPDQKKLPFGNFQTNSGAGDSVESGGATEGGEESSGGGNEGENSSSGGNNVGENNTGSSGGVVSVPTNDETQGSGDGSVDLKTQAIHLLDSLNSDFYKENNVYWTAKGEVATEFESQGKKYVNTTKLMGSETTDYNAYKIMFGMKDAEGYRDQYVCFGKYALYYDSDKNELYYYKVVEDEGEQTPSGTDIGQSNSGGAGPGGGANAGGIGGGSEKKESNWDKVVAWWNNKVVPAWNNIWAEKEPEYTDEDREVTRGLASFETHGDKYLEFDRGLKSGDNFTVEIDGQSYAVESRGEVKREKAAHLYADAEGVANGEVFLYGDGMFLKKGGKIYSVDARKLFGKGQAEDLKSAIKANAAEGEGGSSAVYDAVNAGDAKGSLKADNYKAGEYEAFDKISFINILGESYKLQVRAMLGSDSSAYKAAVSSGIEDGQLFRHGQDFYVKDGEKVLKMSATSGKTNSDYDALVNLDENALDKTLNRRVCGAVQKNDSSVKVYIGSKEYSAKLERDVSKNEIVANIAKEIDSGEVFAIGKRLYFKDGSKLWMIEKDEDLYKSFMSGKEYGEYDATKTSVIIPDEVTTFSYDIAINGAGFDGNFTDTNIFDKGEELIIPLDAGDRYTAKCLYKTTGNAYKAAKAAGLENHQIYFWADELYVFCDDYSLRLGGKEYDKLKKKLEEQQSSVATVGDAKGLYSQHLT